jgi:hypothetical protein
MAGPLAPAPRRPETVGAVVTDARADERTRTGAAPTSSVARLRHWVRNEAASVWGVPPSLAEAVLVIPFIGALALGATRLDLALYDFLTREDSVLEWSQVGLYALAAVGAAVVARTLQRAGRRGPALVYLLFALGMVFVAGEEISWGQRIFGWGTPRDLDKINAQDETTVHNISSVEFLFKLGYTALGLYGSVVAWWVRRRVESWHRETVNLYVAPVFLGGAFFVIFLHRLAYFLGARGYTYTRSGEWAEFCLAFALATFAYLSWRRITRRARVQSSPAASSAGVGSPD